MSWNGPINGDYSNCDFTKAPWAAGIMVLTHEEVLHVLTETQKIIDAYVPKYGQAQTPDDNTYIVPEYNKLDWTYCINGDTYSCIKGYNPEINILGINEQGIVQPTQETPDQETSTDVTADTSEVNNGIEEGV